MREVHLLILCLAVVAGSAEQLNGAREREPETKEEQIAKVFEGANLLAEWAGLDLDESNKDQVLDFVKALHDISMDPERASGAEEMIEFGLDTFFANISDNPIQDTENATTSGEAEQDCKYCLSREEFTQISKMYLTLQKWFPDNKHANANKLESAPIFYYLKKALMDRSHDDAKIIINYMFRMVRGTKNNTSRRSKINASFENNDIDDYADDDCDGDDDSDREIKITLGFSKNMFAPTESEPKHKHKSHRRHHGNHNNEQHDHHHERSKRDISHADELNPSIDEIVNARHHHSQSAAAEGSSPALTPPRMLEPKISYLYPYSHQYDRGNHGDNSHSRRSYSSSSRGHSGGRGHSLHREPEGFSRRSMGSTSDVSNLPSIHNLYRKPPPRGMNNAPSPIRSTPTSPPSFSRRSFGPSDDSRESSSYHHDSPYHSSHHGSHRSHHGDSHRGHRYQSYSGEDYGRIKREIDQPMDGDGIVELVDGLVVGRNDNDSVSTNVTTLPLSLTENGNIQLDDNENATEANTRSKRAAAAAGKSGSKKSKPRPSSRRSMGSGGKSSKKSKQFSRRSMGPGPKKQKKVFRRSFGSGGSKKKSTPKFSRRSFGGSKKRRNKRSADYFSSRDFMTQYGKSYQAHLLQEASKANSRRVIRDSNKHMAEVLEGASLARRSSTNKPINKDKKNLTRSSSLKNPIQTVTSNATLGNQSEQTEPKANDTADTAGKKEEPVIKVQQQLEDIDIERLQNSTAAEIEKLKAEKKTILRHLVEQYERETLKDLTKGLDKSDDSTKIKN